MNVLKQYFQNLSIGQLTCLALLLCLPAFLINLGTIAFIGDEGIRTLVALEMKLSGNYLIPTLNAEPYYNKPPLYNWFILIVSFLFGHFGEWPTRVTTLIFLGLFSWTVYFFSRKHFDKLTSISLVLMLLTSGRILFWDSMLGLIDICFSWVIYLNFMVLYHFGKSGRWRWMFFASYLLCSFGFLLKGLPAIVFQAISMITALFFHGMFRKKIFSSDHFIGIGMGLLPVIFYYVLYASQVSLEHVFSILWDQSLQRTAAEHGILKTIRHVFTFPFEQFYHFLPWSVLIITFFHPRSRHWIRSHPFVHFSFWMLVVNLPVYWLSAQVHPRYLLMFLPLFNLIALFVLQQTVNAGQKWWRYFHYLFVAVTGMLTLIVILMPLVEQVRTLQGIHLVWFAGIILMVFCFLGVFLDVPRMFIWFSITMLVARLLFNLIVLPIRAVTFRENDCREDCRRLAMNHDDKSWYIFGETEIHQVARYYTSGYTNQIIRKTDTVKDSSALYLVDRTLYPGFPGIQIDSLLLERGQVIAMMKVK